MEAVTLNDSRKHRHITLSKGEICLVDDGDYDVVSKHKWRAVKKRDKNIYAVRTTIINGRRTSQYMHSLITGYKITDHKNGNGLDNRRENLRNATSQQNRFNQRKTKGMSKYKGAYKCNTIGKWEYGKYAARIQIDGKTKHLGYFDVEEDAALAYDSAARNYFGEFAVLNFPKEGERGPE